MEPVHYLIIGGGIAGTAAAETVRQRDRTGKISIVSSEPHRLYSRIMLSKPDWFSGKIPEGSIWLKKPEWYADHRIELIAGRRAARLDAAKKEVALDGGAVMRYDKLLLAIGTCPRLWGIKGSDKRGVHYLRTLDDAKKIIEEVKTAKKAAVAGGGAIGFEICELLRLAGLEVTLIIRERHYWDPVLDEPSGRLIESALERNGVRVMRGRLVDEVAGGEHVERLALDDGSVVESDMVVVGIGGVCEIDAFRQSGVRTGRGIIADRFLETSIPDVFVAGDAAEAYDPLSDEHVMYGSWSNAQQQGRTAALNMTGERQEYRFVSTYTVHGFGITICFAGNINPLQDRRLISRRSPDGRSCGRLFIKDGRVIGATFIDRTAEMGPVSKLIAAKTDVSARLDDLGDDRFDLSTLIQ